MIKIREIESSTQEVSFLLTVVSSISILVGCSFFISSNTEALPLVAGQFGMAFFQFLFDMFGYASFYLSIAIFSIGRYLISQGLNYKDLFKLSPQVLTKFVSHLFALVIFSSLFRVFHSYYGFSINQRLVEGAGGAMGELVGGTFYVQFGLYGSLVLLTSLALIVGISVGYIQLVNLLLHTNEKLQIFKQYLKIKLNQYSIQLRKKIDIYTNQLRLQLSEHIPFLVVEPVGGPSLEQIDIDNKEEVDLEKTLSFNIEPQVDQNYQPSSEVLKLIERMDKQIHDLEEKIEAGQINIHTDKVSKKKKSKKEDTLNTLEDLDEKEVDGNDQSPKEIQIKEWLGKYSKPELSLLDKATKIKMPSKESIQTQCEDLEKRLESFQIKGKVIAAHVGVTLTMYEFEPAPGMKLSKITGLTNDLALVLGASSIRVLAPIPGKMTVGIEVPNKEASAVPYNDLVKKVLEKKEMALPIALGLDVYNNPVISDIATMPHMLVSGTTGSGKSVFMNTLITSLLFNKSPKELRFLMVDPKMIELSPYNGIPHLLKPVVTDVEEAKDLLVWAEQEMDRRYQMFADVQARNIESFNETIKETNKKSLERRIDKTLNWKWQNMPYIVIVIDELADLMITQGKEVEVPITRIAQKARAAGIHLIIATQRPSAEIVTGLIKTNFPTRIAFKVSSSIDSRTILDTSGGEKLLGKGDMLYMPNGKSLERIQGAFISEKEVKKIVKKISKK